MALLGEDDAVAGTTVTTSSRDRFGDGPGTSAEGQQITSPASPPASATAGRNSLRPSPEHAGSPPMLHPLSRMELATRRDRTKRRRTKAVSASSIVVGGMPSALHRSLIRRYNGTDGWSGGAGGVRPRDHARNGISPSSQSMKAHKTVPGFRGIEVRRSRPQERE